VAGVPGALEGVEDMPAHYRPGQGIGPTALLCHGFPDAGHQLCALAKSVCDCHGRDFRYWHRAAQKSALRLVRSARVLRTSTGSGMEKTSSSSMQLASDQMSGSSESDVLKGDAASCPDVPEPMLARSYLRRFARCRMATVSSARIERRF